MNIEKRELAEIPDFIHELAMQCLKEHERAKATLDGEKIIAQYIDMAFRSGFESAKGIYKKQS